MNEKQECRAKGLEMALMYKGNGNWSADNVVKWAHVFAVYIETGRFEKPAASTTRS